MKSAYELAMERLKEEQGDVQALTDEQKQRLAEVEQEATAAIAGRELSLQPQIEAALAQGDIEDAGKLKVELERDVARLRDKAETAKQRIRDEESADS